MLIEDFLGHVADDDGARWIVSRLIGCLPTQRLPT